MRFLSSSTDALVGHSDCKLISGYFATGLQVVLGLIAMSTLLYKRYVIEADNPRPYDTWLMDCSKQGVQSVFIHFSNIALAIIFANLPFDNSSASHDECAFYFITFVLDTFLGIHLIWLVLRGVRIVAISFGWQSVRDQGYYGTPPAFSWYIQQLYVFLGATAVSKFVIGLGMLMFRNDLDLLGTLLFKTFHMRPDTELTVVMIICPCFLNAIQYWIQDNILMSSSSMRHEYSDLDIKQHEDVEKSLISVQMTTGIQAPRPSPGSKDGAFLRVRSYS